MPEALLGVIYHGGYKPAGQAFIAMGVQQQIEGYQYAQEEIKQSTYEAEYSPAGYLGVFLGVAGEMLA